MSGHTQDGKIWVVRTRDGKKVRVHPNLLASFPSKFKLPPSSVAKPTATPKTVRVQEPVALPNTENKEA